MSIKNVGEGLRRWAAVCGLVFGVLCLAGCRSQPHGQQLAEPPGGGATTSAGAALKNSSALEPEVLRIGDSLTVSFIDTPNPIPAFQEKIKEDGTITLALNQVFKADGKTRGELEKEIRLFYVPDYFKQLTVTVTPDVSTRWYYVDGEVKAPNRQVYNSRITVLKAIASVGGFTDFANKKKVRLARVDGRTQTVNCVKALDNPSLDLEIYPGDKIHVPRKIW
jgi:protein involved in polysaccharide export with SLBB domain